MSNLPDILHSRLSLGLVVALVGVVLGLTSAEGVPAFARKYQTSCQTCHTVFPKLNAFGAAFRLKGYRMPGESEEMVKEKPVSLGAPVYKRLWPKAVWPGELSSTVPLALNIKMALVNTSTLNGDGTVTTLGNDFQFPQEVNLFGAGTLGEHVSYLAEATFSENPDSSVSVSLEHARLQFDSPFGPEDLLHIRIGKFAPNLVDGFQEMWMSTDAAIDSIFAYNPIGVAGGVGLAGDTSPQPISLPDRIRGIEAYGIVHHRVLWVAGIANGISPGTTGGFDGNNAKDFYARVDYKIGGMGLDGYNGDKPVPAENWRDDSLRLGAFVYRGDGSQINFPIPAPPDTAEVNVQDAHFLRTGVYASVYVRDLNVFGAYVHGSDTIQQLDPGSGGLVGESEPTYDSFFAQADYMVYPWLQASGRFETVRVGDRSVPSLRSAVFNLSALVRANVKAMLEYQRDLRAGENHSLNVVVRFAF